MRHKQTDEHKLLRMENIGQIYHKNKIREILNCDMTKALTQDF